MRGRTAPDAITSGSRPAQTEAADELVQARAGEIEAARGLRHVPGFLAEDALEQAALERLRARVEGLVPVVRIAERIESGQSVACHRVEGLVGQGWRELATGATIGYARLHRIEPVELSALRVVVEEAVAPVGDVRIAMYR